nr:cardiolipin synthase [Clostridia bacterium]
MKKKISKRQKQWIERTVDNDRTYKLLLYNRFYIYALLVLFQIAGWALFLILLTYNSAWAFSVQILTGALALISILYIINRHERPSLKLGWILLILIAPVFGVPLYLTCGEGRQTRRMQKKIDEAKAENEARAREVLKGDEPKLPQEREEGISYYLSKYAGYPAYTDGEVTYYESGEKMFPAIKEALEEAKKFILVEYFIIAHGKMWGDILKILLKKAEEGVQVRVLYDDFGCMTTLPPKYDRYLESLHENIRCQAFNKVIPVFTVRMNNRDHRKILVVDGKTAFTGGVNLADEYIAEKRRFGYWKDSGLRITGSAVNSFTSMFFYLWNACRKDKEGIEKYLFPTVNADMPSSNGQNGVIQPYDDSPLDKISVGEHVYTDMIDRASKYIYIFTPYLILDDFMRDALCRASMRGVDVRIVTPSIPDKKTVYRLTRANYGVLMGAGVKIYEYTPGFIHAKSMVCDGEYAVVGTINLDYRSLYLHFENAVYFSHCPAVGELVRDCEETFAVSKLCTKENVKRGVIGRLFDSVLRVFETLL